MKKFLVRFQAKAWMHRDIIVEAKDEQDARAHAYAEQLDHGELKLWCFFRDTEYPIRVIEATPI